MRINGYAVQDAKRKMVIHVTDYDVREGAKKNSNACAAARAIMRESGCDLAKVHANRTYIKRGTKWYRYQTPNSLTKEIVAFDRGGTFEPGEYTLIPLKASQRQGARLLRASTTKKYPKRKNHVTTGVRARVNDFTQG